MLRIDTIHNYPHPTTGSVGARCRLRIYEGHDGIVVVSTALPDNRGMSVTNVAEDLATELVAKYQLDPAHTCWVEHYPPRLEIPESWDEITFTWHDGKACGVRWRRLAAETVEVWTDAELAS